jgi:hypothetical protein
MILTLGQVMAQPGMVVEVLVAQGQRVNALAQQTQRVVVTARLPPGILQGTGEGIAQAEAAVDLLQQ